MFENDATLTLLLTRPVNLPAHLAAGSADFPPYVVTCGGRERGGALCMLRQHAMPEVLTDVPLQGVVGILDAHCLWCQPQRNVSQWRTLPGTGAMPTYRSPNGRRLPLCALIRSAGVLGVWAVHQRPDAPAAEAAEAAEADEGYHAYLLISFPGSSKVLATGEELQEVTDE